MQPSAESDSPPSSWRLFAVTEPVSDSRRATGGFAPGTAGTGPAMSDPPPEVITISKAEPGRDGSLSSMGSSPEPDGEAFTREHTVAQKRKGGRKPIYATSEERKQRNRQAQAAFRERRTEYIKQLETTIKHHEDTLQNLQQSHRSAADECLMLRYKNSLLERILLEKGIDVRAELNAKTDSSHVRPDHVPHGSISTPQPPPMPQALMNRHHPSRRSASSVAPKLEPGPQMASGPLETVFPTQSPQLQPTPPSQTSSPSLASTGFVTQGVMTPPSTELLAQQRQQPQRPPPQPLKPSNQMHPGLASTASGGVRAPQSLMPATTGPGGSGSKLAPSYFPSPFQSHIDQLEQEYDAQADMLDDQDPSDHSAGPGPYPQTHPSSHGMPHLPNPLEQHQQHGQSGQHPHLAASASVDDGGAGGGGGGGGEGGPPYSAVNELYGASDLKTDDDPFGLWQRNDPDQDSDKEPEPPTTAVDKSLGRSSKRNDPDVAPSSVRAGAGAERGGRGGYRGGAAAGNEGAFQDRSAGSQSNRGKPIDDGLRQDRHSDRLGGGRGQGSYDGPRGRGGRGRRGGAARRDDRHSRTNHPDSDKQVAQGWGGAKGDSEWNDEKAGEAIAKAEEKEGGFDTAPDAPIDGEGTHPSGQDENVAPAAEEEPEENTKSYAEYLAEQAEKKLQLGSLPVRKANENTKQDKKWAQAKELKKDEDENAYIAGAAAKVKRERARKEKNLLDLDQRFVEPSRGGREGSRGGRGRGEGRGEFRGSRGGGRGRGDYRGGRGGSSALNPKDNQAFPSLGGS
ncbi:MAG: hypothetical protein M1837_002956 [Sclerophora amabilis]|nr:MAG: hypothetical protein M1837_002956 [Sclerophora amabilis]